MSALAGLVGRFAHFWYDFVVGDDWTVAAGVIAAVALTAVAAHAGWAAWLILPAAVLGGLLWSVGRARSAHLSTDRARRRRT